MNISMRFEGYSEEIINSALRKGVAKTKAEAIRLGLLQLNDKYGLVPRSQGEIELDEDLKEIARIERDIKSGKEKLHKVKNIDSLFK